MVRASAKVYRLVDGTDQFFHSSWEADVANALIRSGVEYDAQLLFELGDVRYLADFWIPSIQLVVEVKGHPRAWKRWNEVTLPALRAHGSRDIRYAVMASRLPDGALWSDVQEVLQPVDLGPAPVFVGLVSTDAMHVSA
jgi:hypothetical protein